MVIVEVRLFSKIMSRPGSDCFCFQLATGKMPFPEFNEIGAKEKVLRGKRPPKPRSFDAVGITPAVWNIAKKCWHQKAKERLKVNAVLEYLENLANPSPGGALTILKRAPTWKRR